MLTYLTAKHRWIEMLKAILKFSKTKECAGWRKLFCKKHKKHAKTDFHGDFSLGLLGDRGTSCVIWPLWINGLIPQDHFMAYFSAYFLDWYLAISPIHSARSTAIHIPEISSAIPVSFHSPMKFWSPTSPMQPQSSLPLPCKNARWIPIPGSKPPFP